MPAPVAALPALRAIVGYTVAMSLLLLNLMGMFQFVTGALVMAVVGLFVDGSSWPMVAGIGACALAALVVSYRTLAAAPGAGVMPKM